MNADADRPGGDGVTRPSLRRDLNFEREMKMIGSRMFQNQAEPASAMTEYEREQLLGVSSIGETVENIWSASISPTRSGLGPHDGADGSHSTAARAFGSFAGHVDSPQHPTISFSRNRMSQPAIMAEGRLWTPSDGSHRRSLCDSYSFWRDPGALVNAGSAVHKA
jgi:hypothetical protein